MSAATEYLQSYENYFWRYEDQGKVIAIPEGRTLGYTDQVIKEIVFHLAPYGLPRFGSLLLAIAATTPHGTDTLDDIMEIVEARAERTEAVEKGIWFAKLLEQLPPKIKQGNLRILLLQAVFTQSHNGVGPKKSTQILRELKAIPSISEYTVARREKVLTEQEISNSLVSDFKTLAIIGRELNDVPTIMKRISNLPSVTHALETLELEPRQKGQERSFVDKLQDKQDTFHVGALVASLISGLQISFHASLPSEQPLGGVADITNKGSFDKLLTSEYAFDDQVLLSRLANSEALYKHREVPPADNTYPRVLLIDTTLKNWGIVRTISFAAALAIAHHPKNKQPVRVFLVGKSYREIAVSTVTDVINGLNTLDSSLDPGIGIEDLFSREALKASELFFFGTETSLASPGMQRLSADSGKLIDHWIHPDENGVVRVYKNPKRGKRFVQELKLPLGKLWSKPKIRKVVSSTASFSKYPILFPEMRIKATWQGKEFLYGVTKSMALMRLYSGHVRSEHGWELIPGEVRRRDDLKAVITHDDLSVRVLFATQAKEYTIVSYPGGEVVKVAMDRRLSTKRVFYVEEGCFKTDVGHSTVCIDQKGQITEQALVGPRRSRGEPFRNRTNNFSRQMNNVSITLDDHLRFRKHDLIIRGSSIMIQHRVPRIGIKLKAVHKTQGTFTFPDGSSVVHNPNGMITLKSADPTLLDIHLPTQMDVPLGIATREAFTGPVYYQMKPRIEMILNPSFGQEAQLASLIDQGLNYVNLNRAEEMAKDGLIVCEDEMSFAKLDAILSDFSYRVRRRGLPQQKLEPLEFYNQYIKSFITHILNHGTNA